MKNIYIQKNIMIGLVVFAMMSFAVIVSAQENWETITTTLSATQITETSVRISGSSSIGVDVNEAKMWFEYGINNVVLNNKTDPLTLYTTTEAFSDVRGLIPNTTYYYRIVSEAYNQVVYGEIKNFTTKSTNNSNVVVNSGSTIATILNTSNTSSKEISLLVAVTNIPIIIEEDSITLRGIIKINDGSESQGWFEWGEGKKIRNRTEAIYVGVGSKKAYETEIKNLKSATLYYYRAVAQNQNGLTRGDLIEVMTKSSNTVIPVVSTQNKNILNQNAGVLGLEEAFLPDTLVEWSIWFILLVLIIGLFRYVLKKKTNIKESIELSRLEKEIRREAEIEQKIHHDPKFKLPGQ